MRADIFAAVLTTIGLLAVVYLSLHGVFRLTQEPSVQRCVPVRRLLLDRAAVADRLTAAFGGRLATCQLCAKDHYRFCELAQQYVYTVDPARDFIPRKAVPLVVVYCGHCGHILHMSAAALGIVDKDGIVNSAYLMHGDSE